MKSIVLSPAAAHLTHLVFEWLAITVGVQTYRWQRRRAGQGGILELKAYAVVIGCILGAAIGNKLVFWLEFPQLWAHYSTDPQTWAAGQSIVGGLLGGMLGVELAKKLTKQTQSTGDLFVLPLIVGTVIGRIGCFLAGLNDGTFGNATTLPWGIDFGDGIPRHPTQVYDMLFVVSWGVYLFHRKQRWATQAGLHFKLYLAGYLLWRAVVDALKPVPYNYGFGLSGIQLVCIIGFMMYLPSVIRQLRQTQHNCALRGIGTPSP